MGKRRRRSEYELGHRIARRLVHAKAQPSPYTDDRPLYVALHGKRDGERLNLGLPLRAHRMFPTKSRSRAHRLATDFAAYAATADQSDWRVWTIHYPSRKTEIGGLAADLKRFNRRINSVFGQLRKHCQFELLIIGIHIDWDCSTSLFDIHAHFVCKIPGGELREDARRRLMTAFSRAHTPDDKLRTPHGFAVYASRTFKLSRVVRWRSEAIVAAWDLINHRPRYVRTGRAFAEWRRKQRPGVDVQRQQAARKKRENRKATRYQGTGWDHRDRPLVRKTWKIGEENVPGTLFRSALGTLKPAGARSPAASNRNPSAFGDTTQPLPNDRHAAGTRKMSTSSIAETERTCEYTAPFELAGFQRSVGAEVYRCNHDGRLQVTLARSDHMNYITKIEVHDAADRIDSDGQRPSAKTVRALVGRGSFTTIDNHLQSWVPRDQRLELPPVPEGLTAAVSSVITDLWHISRAAVHAETAAQIERANANVAEARAAAQHAGEKADRLADELRAERQRSDDLEKMIAKRDQQIEEYADCVRQWQVEDARKTGEIESLQRLVAQFAPAATDKRKGARKDATEQPAA